MKRIFYYAAAIMALALFAVSCEKASHITHTPGVSVCCEGTLSTCLPPSENGFKFSTSIAGEYIFSASYEGEHSEPVTVNAI